MELAQLSVFLDLKQGGIAELAELFGREDINFRALTLSDTRDFGILRFIVDDSDKAEEILRANHFTVVVSEVVAVEVEDKPGALGEVYRILDRKKIKVEYMYAFSQGPSNKAVLVHWEAMCRFARLGGGWQFMGPTKQTFDPPILYAGKSLFMALNSHVTGVANIGNARIHYTWKLLTEAEFMEALEQFSHVKRARESK